MSNQDYWQLTLDLALLGKGLCAPNPAVGAVVVKEGEVIATGYHQGPGKPHAEADALNKLSLTKAKGATLYITLEPCCHHGRTPPCTELIIKYQLAEVFYAYQDPNPAVAGQGAKQLRAVGISCKHQPSKAIDLLYQSYTHWWQTGKPFVTAKLAVSADNYIAGANGEPVAITGPEANYFTHLRRRYSDAILTTATTLITDNPKLNARLDNQEFKKPLYILDRELRFPLDAQVNQTAQSITLFYDDRLPNKRLKAFVDRGIRCIGITCQNQQLNLAEIITSIGNDGTHDLWLEAGAHCFKSFVTNQLANCIYLYQSRKLLGNNAYPANVHLDLFANYKPQPISQLGEDLLLSWELNI